MKTKQTAMQELLEIVESMVEKSLMGDQSKGYVVGYQVASCWIKDNIKELLIKEKEQMIDFAEFVSLGYPSKNRNFQGEILHARSKYDSSERTIDLLEIYYNKYYGINTKKDNSEN